MEPTTLRIGEIFFSIQGESLFVGKPTVFIRTATCNLRCRWCDSPHSHAMGTVVQIEEILKEVEVHGTRFVCITGGEPLGHAGVYPLMNELLQRGYTVSLETNGSFLIKNVPPQVVKIMDIKCPDSGESHNNCWENIGFVSPQDQIKFVLASRSDFDWAEEVCRTHALNKLCHILFSPAFGLVRPDELAQWILSSHSQVTMQLQLHKVIWEPSPSTV